MINLNISASSASKGESLLDTIDNLAAMHADMFVVRHAQSGAPYLIAKHLTDTGRSHVHVVNAGDGRHAHPTQGLLDMYTIRHYKKDFTNLTRGHRRRHPAQPRRPLGHPCADHAGRARSARDRPAHAAARAAWSSWACGSSPTCDEGLKDVDVIIMLRLQNERMSGALLPSAQEYFKSYGLTTERLALAKPDAIVMHPGPMNRGVEIESAVADGTQAVILPQVTFGIAVRMAVMSIIAGN